MPCLPSVGSPERTIWMRLTWSRATGRARSERKAFQGHSEPRPPSCRPRSPSSWSGSWASWPPSRTVTGHVPGPRLACRSRTLFWRPTPVPSRQPTEAHGGSCPHRSSRSRPAARLSERSTYGHPASRPGIQRSSSSRYSVSKACRARLPKGAPPAKQRAPCFHPQKAALSAKRSRRTHIT